MEFYVKRSVPSYFMLKLTDSCRAHIVMRMVSLPMLAASIERDDDMSWPRPSRRRLDCSAVWIDGT